MTEMGIRIKVVRSKRRSLSLQVKPQGVILHAPQQASDDEIRAFVHEHRKWLITHASRVARARAEALEAGKLSPEEVADLKEEGKKVFRERIAHYEPMLGVRCRRVTVRAQKTKWGSCSAAGNLNLNCLLLLAPPEVLDSVVVHELCHLKEMNHSAAFYRHVRSVFPEYDRWNHWLKEHGPGLLQRLPEPG
ncbi:MAG: DUF45 domain-containing protein [Lachnospiraceae bacterium]|nr:DUF45 domain-containing protein [Lachnospiraceae bacterium]